MTRPAVLLAAVALAASAAKAQNPPSRDTTPDTSRAVTDSAPAAADTSRSGRRLRDAALRNPSSAAAQLAYGRYLRGATIALARREAREHLEVAARLARERGNRAVEADALVELGRISWIGYEGLGRRWGFRGAVTGIDPFLALADWRYVAA